MLYKNFLNAHSPDIPSPHSQFPVPSEDFIKHYQLQPFMKAGLIELWQTYGFCSFHQGLFWLINPDEWQNVMEIFGLEGRVIIRGSFGNLVYVNVNGEVWLCNAILGKNYPIVENLDFFFPGLLANKDFVKDMFMDNLHQQALKRLGKLVADEMYGFEPLLSLGGTESIKNAVKVKAKEHLALLAQSY